MLNDQDIRKLVEEALGKISAPPAGGLSPSSPAGPPSFAADRPVRRAAPEIPSTCRAAVLVEKERIEVREFPIRDITDDEILIRVEGCGVCGTDVHEFKHDPFNLVPVVLGHEGTGEIVRLGRNITRDSGGKVVKVGDKVVTSVMNCGKCDACLYTPGRTNLCENLGVYGLLRDEPRHHLNGWFSEYIIVRRDSTFFVVNDINLNLRMLIEPAAVVVHALERAKATGLLTFRSRVLIQGCGPIGLLMLAAVRTAGCQHIVALDGDDNRLHMAHRLGADKIINYKSYPNPEELAGAVKNATKGIGAHFAFQCTGVPSAASNIWKYVRRGGGICEVGFFVDGGNATVNPHHDICRKEITLVGSWVYTVDEYPIAYNFMRRAEGIGLPVEDLITHRFGLQDLQEAMHLNLRQEGIKLAYLAELNR